MMKLDSPTDSEKTILDGCFLLFERFYKGAPIRKVGVSLGNLVNKNSVQLSLFDKLEDLELEDEKNKIIDEIKKQFGKNSLVKASALLEDSTIKERNKKIGGHSA